MATILFGLVSAARKTLGLVLILTAACGTALALPPTTAVPEIDAGSVVSALTLLAGGVLILGNGFRRSSREVSTLS